MSTEENKLRLYIGHSYARARIIAKKLKPLNAGRAFAHWSAGHTAVKCCVVVILALSGLVALLFSRNAGAESATIPATVNIKVNLAITHSSELDFGQVRPANTDGTVVVTTSNTRFATGGVVLRGPKFSRAEFVISGQPGTSYNIVPAASISLHDQRGDPIPVVTGLQVVNLLSFSTTVGAITTTGQIGLDGTDRVFVGGTLLVPPTALNGYYSGSVELTINY